MQKQKRALAIHDISCVGKCSLTVALPVISAAGIETSVLPTSILSTHTGGFEGYTFKDLTEDINPIANHWATLDIPFDAIYTGYLGSQTQIALVMDLFERFGGDNTMLLVDPVMADNGKLYPGFSESFPSRMAELCKKADIIIPNITEATLMLGEEYMEGPYTHEYIQGLLCRLGEAFGGKIVLTGVYYETGQLGAAGYDAGTGEGTYSSSATIPGYYHGTGDVFGSGLLSALLNGHSLADAIRTAVDFTVTSIKLTDPDREPRYGVRFEAALPSLMKDLKLL